MIYVLFAIRVKFALVDKTLYLQVLIVILRIHANHQGIDMIFNVW